MLLRFVRNLCRQKLSTIRYNPNLAQHRLNLQLVSHNPSMLL
jgi:hypothetical protein